MVAGPTTPTPICSSCSSPHAAQHGTDRVPQLFGVQETNAEILRLLILGDQPKSRGNELNTEDISPACSPATSGGDPLTPLDHGALSRFFGGQELCDNDFAPLANDLSAYNVAPDMPVLCGNNSGPCGQSDTMFK